MNKRGFFPLMFLYQSRKEWCDLQTRIPRASSMYTYNNYICTKAYIYFVFKQLLKSIHSKARYVVYILRVHEIIKYINPIAS